MASAMVRAGAAQPSASPAADAAEASTAQTEARQIPLIALAARGGEAVAEKHSSGSGVTPSLPLNSADGAPGAALLLVNPSVAADTAPVPALKLSAAVGSAEFGQEVAGQVSLMVDRNLNSASLQVNPPALGPIEVRIALQGGHAQVWLASHSALTRDALESSSSSLREMLGNQGFGQVSVDISQRSFQERSSQSQVYDALPAERVAPGASAQSRSAGSMPRTASGLVDAYA